MIWYRLSYRHRIDCRIVRRTTGTLISNFVGTCAPFTDGSDDLCVVASRLCEFHLAGKKMSNLGIWIGFSFAGLCVFGIVYAALAMKTPADLSPRQLNLVILISGGLVGWVVGMLITPVSPKDQAVFSETGKALSTFVMGYLVAKIDRIFDVAMKKDENVNALFVGRLLMFVSMFALGILATFVWRSYVHLG
jgi:xanthosine utilization system XapX-like protein